MSMTAIALGIGAPLAVGVVSALTQLYAVRDRRARTGQGWDARDTFEVKDAVFAVVVMLVPIALGIAFMDAKLDLPRWQWWGVLIAIGVISTPFSMAYGRWSKAQRTAFEANASAHNDSGAPQS